MQQRGLRSYVHLLFVVFLLVGSCGISYEVCIDIIRLRKTRQWGQLNRSVFYGKNVSISCGQMQDKTNKPIFRCIGVWGGGFHKGYVWAHLNNFEVLIAYSLVQCAEKVFYGESFLHRVGIRTWGRQCPFAIVIHGASASGSFHAGHKKPREMPNVCTAFSVLFCLVALWPAPSRARSDDYYQILREFSQGKDFYETLGISEEATPSETKKAYHKLSLL